MSRDTHVSVVGAHLASLRHLPGSDLIIRFAFGAVISGVAGAVSVLAGSKPGGLLLAFPAILPATLTLVEKEDGERPAEDLDVGAILGAAAMAPFAAVVWLYMEREPAPLILAAAAAAWLVTALLLYVGLRLLLAREVPLHTGLTEAVARRDHPPS
jgi:uncharacterized membrane protein (GlpM family)